MNPLSDALKARRMGSVPKPQEATAQGADPGAKVPLEELVASLDPESKMKLMTILQSDLKTGEEGEEIEGESVEESKPDINGPSAVTSGEIEEANAEVDPSIVSEARDIFKGQENALGEPDPEGQKVRGIGDRMKMAVNKYLKK